MARGESMSIKLAWLIRATLRVPRRSRQTNESKNSDADDDSSTEVDLYYQLSSTQIAENISGKGNT